MTIRISSMLLLSVLILALSAFRGLQAAEFRAAVVKVDITPDSPQMLRGYSPRMFTKVHDRLYHRIVALDDGTTLFFLISSDLCSLSPAFCDRVTGNLAKELGLPGENIWWSITHTHSSPYVGPPGVPGLFMPNRFQFPVDDGYTALVETALADGVRQARQKLAPARLGVGPGYAEANMNRRARGADGQVRLGLNPFGAVDRRIGLVRLEKADGTPLALLANYAMHGTVLGGTCTVVSADGPGAVAEYVEEKIGAAMLYLNGAAGNIAPLYSARAETEIKLLDRFKVLLGDPILEANRRPGATTAEVKLRASRIHIVPGDLRTLRLPPLMASLVVSEDLENSGFDGEAAMVQRLFDLLRPYGGAACLPVSEPEHTALDQVIQSARIPGSRLARSANRTWLLREGGPPDAADWQHESGDAAHTFASQDRGAKPPFGVLWFGGEIDRVLPPFKGSVPRIAAGRMFLQAGNELHAADIYTGRHLWRRPLGRAEQIVAADRELYASSDGVCLRLDPTKGELLGTIAVPASLDKTPGGWEEIRVAGDALLGIAGKHLVCVDRTSGRLRWQFGAERDGISFAVGKNMVYCVDYWLPRHRRRGDAKSEESTIIALDAGSGKVAWQTAAVTPAVTEPPKPPDLPSLVSPQLAWSEASGVLLFTRNDSTAAAYQGATGKRLWAQELSCKDPPNAYTSASPPIVLSDCLVAHAGEVVDLVTGERRARMWKGMNSELRGCGRALGSPCLITVRDAHLSCYDLAGGGHLYFRGIRSGCTHNVIPAGGILSAPNALRHCTCNYAVATSLALVNMPEASNWETSQWPN